MKKAGKKSKYLLDIFVKIRTVKSLDRVISRNNTCQDTMNRKGKTFDRLDNAGLSGEQETIIDRVISSANHCSTVYDAVAYRLDLQDRIRLASEIKAFE